MKNNLFHVLPPLYVQNKNGSRDYKPIPHLNLTFYAQRLSKTTDLCRRELRFPILSSVGGVCNPDSSELRFLTANR